MNAKNAAGYTQCAVIGCNVSYRREITAGILKNILLGKQEIGHWIGHIDTFFNELPAEVLVGFLRENGISYEDVKRCYDALPPVLQGEGFKKVMQAYS